LKMFETLDWRIDNGIGLLALNQPPANTMTRWFFDELSEFMASVVPGSGIRALVIYGNGRHFSAGADHADLKKRINENLPANYPDELPGFLTENTRSFTEIAEMKIPTFAAIRGTCLGSALELALACRYRICGEGTVFGFPESSFGLMPGCGGSVKLPAIVGRAKAIELILSGRNFSAEEAYDWGIVQRVVPRREVVLETIYLARKLTIDK
jgi:enoyl-CoA hydratase